jgi:hypothetical protein
MMLTARPINNSLMLTQNAPDCAGRTWQTLALQGAAGVVLKVLQNRFGTRNTVETLRRVVADIQNTVDYNLSELRHWRVRRTRLTLQNSIVIRRSLQQPLAPLFDPGT